MANPRLQRLDGPSRNSFITGVEDDVVFPIEADTPLLSVLELQAELLQKILNEARITNMYLGSLSE